MAIKLYRSTLLLVLLLTGNAMSAQTMLNDSISSQLKAGVKGFQERYHSPSLVLIIVHKGKVIFSDASGYADLENKVPASVDTKYQIQSITKMFTATLAMNLWEKGIIKLDGDVRKFVPEYTVTDLEGKTGKTTFLELATHNAGLPRNSQADVEFAKQADTWMLINKEMASIKAPSMDEFLKSLRLATREYPEYEFKPHDTRQYSNMGYALLGLGLGRAAKTSYQEAVLNRICRPLHLNNTGFGTVSDQDHVLAMGYSYLNNEQKFIKTPNFYANAMMPAAGMYSTATDLAKFISAQFSGENGVLSEKSIRMMQSLGIGWQRSYPYVKHEGAMLGSRIEIVIHPKLELGWAVLTNVTDFDFNRINEYVSSLVLPLFAEKPVSDLNQYVGTYSLVGGADSIKLYLKDGKLYSTYLEHVLPLQPLTFSGNNSLKSSGLNGHEINYNFLSDKNSKISVLNLSQLMWIKK
jgi:CubicO group peptidase (beta-lactamase class C family)